MNRQRLLPLLGLAFAMFFLAASAQADLYWVAFNGTGGVYKYVMQIDETGKITKAPKAVLSWSLAGVVGEPQNPFGEDSIYGPNAGPVAMALSDKSSTQFYLWMANTQGSLMRFIINKSTLTPTTTNPVFMIQGPKEDAEKAESGHVDFRSLQASQHISNPFLAVNFGLLITAQSPTTSDGNDSISGRAYAFGLTSTGKLNGVSNRMTPRTALGDKTITVSADGLMAVTNVEKHWEGWDPGFTVFNDDDLEEHIYAQPLNANHLPVGDPFVIGNSGPQVGATDVSNVLPGNKRWVVYNTRSTDDVDSSNNDNLVLQPIDATTGQKAGAAHVLFTDIEMVLTVWQGIAIDPQGRFVLFTRRPTNSTPPGVDDTMQGTLTLSNRDSLYFLPLDANGNAAGPAKQLYSADAGPATGTDDENATTGCTECAWPQILGIDILKD